MSVGYRTPYGVVTINEDSIYGLYEVFDITYGEILDIVRRRLHKVKRMVAISFGADCTEPPCYFVVETYNVDRSEAEKIGEELEDYLTATVYEPEDERRRGLANLVGRYGFNHVIALYEYDTLFILVEK